MSGLLLCHIIVKGKVQGVGYRWFVQETAEQLRITGWVKNLPDGDVEIEAQGAENTVNDFVDLLQTGHPHAHVDTLKIDRLPLSKSIYKEFSICY